MDYLEKILFIDLTCHQLGVPDTNHPYFIATLEKLSEVEKNQYVKLTNQIHQIWNYVNMPKMLNFDKRVNSVFEYHEIIQPVEERILTVCRDFGITLKEELTDEFKAAAKKISGKDYFDWFES